MYDPKHNLNNYNNSQQSQYNNNRSSVNLKFIYC